MMPIGRDELKTIVNDAVETALEHRAKLGKNGETWTGYLRRLITPERIGLTVLLIYQLGGNVRDVQNKLETTTRAAIDATQKAEAASRKADESAEAIRAARVELAATITDITTRLQQQATQDADLRDRVSRGVTRTEFTSTVEQQILPRLARIEQRVYEAR